MMRLNGLRYKIDFGGGHCFLVLFFFLVCFCLCCVLFVDDNADDNALLTGFRYFCR